MDAEARGPSAPREAHHGIIADDMLGGLIPIPIGAAYYLLTGEPP
jgi:hypothetical protein